MLCTEAPGHWTATDGKGRQKGPHSCQVPTTAQNVNELGGDAGAGDKTVASHRALWTLGPETPEGHRALGLIRGWGSVLLGLGGAQANQEITGHLTATDFGAYGRCMRL